MKILYMTISYSINGNGLYQNLVDSLLEKGNEVTIVRSKNDIDKTCYGKIKDKFNVLNVKTGDPFSHNLIKKGINQILLANYFKKAIKKFLKDEEFDLILYATPPITLASVVKYCKEKYNAKTFLMLKDIFPQNAVDLGMMKKSSLIYRYFRNEEKKYYKYSDYIGCMSEGNKKYLLKHNPEVDENKVGIFPNSISIKNVKEPKFNEDKTVFMFGGNLGKPQNIPFLLDIINDLKNYKKAEFVIVGSGTESNYIKNFIDNNKLNNLLYKESVPQSEYEELLNNADVGLISLDPRFTIPNIPSKFQTYLKLKKPVFAITDINTDLKDMIINNKCGWWLEAKDKDVIIKNIKIICNKKDIQKEYGLNGFEYLKREFDVNKNGIFVNDYLRKGELDEKE